MNRILASLVALSCLALAACAPERTDLVIQGAVPPAPGTCTWTPGDAKTLEIEGFIDVGTQQDLYNKHLSRFLGFQILNNVSSPASQTPAGNTPAPAVRDDAVVKAFEIVATVDGTNETLASETVSANGYLTHGGPGVAVGDIMGGPLEGALLAKSANFTMHLAVKAKGTFVAGTDFETGAYNFPMVVTYGNKFAAPTDGGAGTLPPGASRCE